MIKHYTILYLFTFGIMVAMDMLWLGLIARGFYKSRLGDQLEFHMLPAIIFYLIYAVGIVIFVNNSMTDKWTTILLNGACLGIVAYATYDLTNLATLRGWPLSITVIDIVWGVVTTSVSATAAWRLTKLFVS